MYLQDLERSFNLMGENFLHFVPAGNCAMQPKLKHGTDGWWNGPNRKTKTVIYFFLFVFFGNAWISQLWRSNIFTVGKTQNGFAVLLFQAK